MSQTKHEDLIRAIVACLLSSDKRLNNISQFGIDLKNDMNVSLVLGDAIINACNSLDFKNFNKENYYNNNNNDDDKLIDEITYKVKRKRMSKGKLYEIIKFINPDLLKINNVKRLTINELLGTIYSKASKNELFQLLNVLDGGVHIDEYLEGIMKG